VTYQLTDKNRSASVWVTFTQSKDSGINKAAKELIVSKITINSDGKWTFDKINGLPYEINTLNPNDQKTDTETQPTEAQVAQQNIRRAIENVSPLTLSKGSDGVVFATQQNPTTAKLNNLICSDTDGHDAIKAFNDLLQKDQPLKLGIAAGVVGFISAATACANHFFVNTETEESNVTSVLKKGTYGLSLAALIATIAGAAGINSEQAANETQTLSDLLTKGTPDKYDAQTASLVLLLIVSVAPQLALLAVGLCKRNPSSVADNTSVSDQVDQGHSENPNLVYENDTTNSVMTREEAREASEFNQIRRLGQRTVKGQVVVLSPGKYPVYIPQGPVLVQGEGFENWRVA